MIEHGVKGLIVALSFSILVKDNTSTLKRKKKMSSKFFDKEW